MPNYTTRPWREYTAVDGHLGTDERVLLFGFPPDVLDVISCGRDAGELPRRAAEHERPRRAAEHKLVKSFACPC